MHFLGKLKFPLALIEFTVKSTSVGASPFCIRFLLILSTMRLKLLLTTLVGALAINGAVAGEAYSLPSKDKTPIECCPDIGGEIAIGYDTDYILYGVRLARDSVWGDVNYTFDSLLPLPLTVGVWHLSSLSGANSFDETDVYGSIRMNEFKGFQTTIGFTHRFFSNVRGPSGTSTVGDSRAEFWMMIERQLACGATVFYRRAYDYGAPSAFVPATANTTDSGAWIHTLGVSKTMELNDRMGLDLSAGVLYSDNFWPADMSGGARARSTGWNSYYVQAGLPIALSCRATLTPYIGYNGSPDTWIADGVNPNGIVGSGANDIFHGGVSLRVSF